MARKLNILKNDPWLEPYSAAIEGRHQDAVRKERDLLGQAKSLDEFANAHQYFGLHRKPDGTWVFREWAPNATGISLVGDFNGWQETPRYRLKRVGGGLSGVWEVKLPKTALKNGQLYKMIVEWDGGRGERIPAYANRVVQDEKTHIFSAQVHNPDKPFGWTDADFTPDTAPLLIY